MINILWQITLRKDPPEYTSVENLFPTKMSWQFEKDLVYNAKSN